MRKFGSFKAQQRSLILKKTIPYAWTPSLNLLACTVLFPGPGFLIGGIAFCIYVLLRALASLPTADTKEGEDNNTGEQSTHKSALLPKPRSTSTRNNSQLTLTWISRVQ